MKKNPWMKLGILGLIVVVLILLYQFTPIASYLQPTYIQDFIGQLGYFGPLVYGLLYVVLTVVFFPASLLTVSGGIIFGTLMGMIYTIIAATIAATVAFYIARYFGKEFAEKLIKGRMEKVDKKLEKGGFQAVAVLRLLYIPYIPLSYAAGLSKVKTRDFVLATFLTNIPGSFAFSYLGGSLGDPRSIILAIVLVVLVLMVPKVVKKFQKSKEQVS